MQILCQYLFLIIYFLFPFSYKSCTSELYSYICVNTHNYCYLHQHLLKMCQFKKVNSYNHHKLNVNWQINFRTHIWWFWKSFILHLNVNEEDETEGIEQVQVINHSSYCDNDMLIPVLLPKTDNFCILSTNIESINAKFS